MAQVEKLAIDQGATYRKTFLYTTSLTTLTPIDLTGYTARMQMRSSPTAAVTSLSLTQLSSLNGQLILGGALGTIQVYITDVATAALSGGGVYDLEIISPSGDVTRLVQGTYAVSPNVTR